MTLKSFSSFLLLITLGLVTSCSNIHNDITTFSINGVAATINDISITVALPAGTSVTALRPNIIVSDGATVSPASGTAVDFTAPVIYTVTGLNKATKQYVAMVTVASVSPSNTPLCDPAIDPSSKGFQSGDGSANKPYVICNAHQLNLIGDPASTTPYLLNKYYILGADIDMSGVTFNPIGDTSINNQAFKGVFDGNNKTISNLTLNYSSGSNVGFICSMDLGSLIKNLGLKNVNITSANNDVGGLVGNSYKGTILNSYVTGSVSGAFYVGGLVGYQWGTTVSGCYTTGTVTGTDHVGGLIGDLYSNEVTYSYSTSNVTASGDYVGGLVGNSSGPVTSCSAIGNVSGVNYVGGLVGYSDNLIYGSYAKGTVTGSGNKIGGLIGDSESNVEYSYATGTVIGTSGENIGGLSGYNEGDIYSSYSTSTVSGGDYAGGLVGYNNSNVRNSFATGSVTGVNYVGGLLGYNKSYVIDSYSIGEVSGTTNFGGLIGYEDGTAEYSYWNTETSGQPDPLTDPGAIGETTETMKDPLSTIYSNWDFINIWSFDQNECFSVMDPPFLPPYCCLRPFVDY